ncbi:transposase [Tenacibaculum maritimum]
MNDRNLLKNSHFHDKVFGKTYVDQGYLSKELFDELFADAIHIVT